MLYSRKSISLWICLGPLNGSTCTNMTSMWCSHTSSQGLGYVGCGSWEHLKKHLSFIALFPYSKGLQISKEHFRSIPSGRCHMRFRRWGVVSSLQTLRSESYHDWARILFQVIWNRAARVWTAVSLTTHPSLLHLLYDNRYTNLITNSYNFMYALIISFYRFFHERLHLRFPIYARLIWRSSTLNCTTICNCNTNQLVKKLVATN